MKTKTKSHKVAAANKRSRPNLADEVVKKNEKRFAVLYQTSSDAIMVLEPPSWKFTSGNPATVKMFRTGTEAKFVSLGPWELSPKYQPDGQLSMEKAKKMINKAVRQGSNFFEWIHKRYRGEPFPATVLLTRVKIDNKTILQATVRDMTEQRKIEEKYKLLVSNIPGMVYRSTNKWATEFVFNSEKVSGYAPKDFAEKKLNWNSLIHPDDKARVLAEAAALATQQKSLVQEYRIITKDKKIKWVEDHKTSVFFDNVFSGVDGVVFDVSRRKEEEKIRESEEKFRSLFENANDAMLMFDERGRFIDINEIACDYFGGARQELLAKTPNDLSKWPFFQDFFKHMKLASQDKAEMYESKHQTKDGLVVFFQVSIKKIEYGQRQAIFVVAHDITKEKQLDAAKSEFLAIASHQLRTPLTSIKWTLEMIKREDGLNPQQAQRLENLSQSNERLIVLANRLLSVTRIEAGRFKAYKKMVNVEELIKEAQKLFLPVAATKRQTLKLEIKTKVAPTLIDPMFFTETANNIINNAVNYAPPGAVITITVTSQGNDYLLSFHNQSPIIPKADQAGVWEKFHRGTLPKNSTAVGSSGLGLFVAKAAVEANGGKIWLKSEPGFGTAFYFTVPKK